jgi:hypothetical protein
VPSWFHFRAPLPAEHSAAATIEQALGASRRYEAKAGLERRTATHALWICACVTEHDAPTWLIHADDDGLAWCRVPSGTEPLDLVQARHTDGNHADPADVLCWLRGDASDPWPWHEYSDEAAVLEALRKHINSA